MTRGQVSVGLIAAPAPERPCVCVCVCVRCACMWLAYLPPVSGWVCAARSVGGRPGGRAGGRAGEKRGGCLSWPSPPGPALERPACLPAWALMAGWTLRVAGVDECGPWALNYDLVFVGPRCFLDAPMPEAEARPLLARARTPPFFFLSGLCSLNLVDVSRVCSLNN